MKNFVLSLFLLVGFCCTVNAQVMIPPGPNVTCMYGYYIMDGTYVCAPYNYYMPYYNFHSMFTYWREQQLLDHYKSYYNNTPRHEYNTHKDLGIHHNWNEPTVSGGRHSRR